MTIGKKTPHFARVKYQFSVMGFIGGECEKCRATLPSRRGRERKTGSRRKHKYRNRELRRRGREEGLDIKTLKGRWTQNSGTQQQNCREQKQVEAWDIHVSQVFFLYFGMYYCVCYCVYYRVCMVCVRLRCKTEGTAATQQRVRAIRGTRHTHSAGLVVEELASSTGTCVDLDAGRALRPAYIPGKQTKKDARNESCDGNSTAQHSSADRQPWGM